MEVPVTPGTLCAHCNQPLSEHTPKFQRCPSWASKTPRTFTPAKTQPRDPMPGDSHTARDVLDHFEQRGPSQIADPGTIGDDDAIEDLDAAQTTMRRLAGEVESLGTTQDLAGAVDGKDDEIDPDTGGACVSCGKPCAADQYCHGCKSYICEDCDVAGQSGGMAGGKHEPEDHGTRQLDDDTDDDEDETDDDDPEADDGSGDVF